MTQPKAADIFISYAAQDRPYADLLKGYLLARNHVVWLDNAIRLGEDWADATTKALEDSRVVVLLLSPGYLNSESALYEAGVALAKMRDNKGKLIGIVVGGAENFRPALPLQKVPLLDARKLEQGDMLKKLDGLIAN